MKTRGVMKRKTAVAVSMIIFAAAGLFCVISGVAGLLQSKRECGFFFGEQRGANYR